MSIGLKTRGPCSRQWMLLVMMSQQISVGDGCSMHADFPPVAKQGRTSDVMSKKICGQTDRSARMSRRVRTTTSETPALLYFLTVRVVSVGYTSF